MILLSFILLLFLGVAIFYIIVLYHNFDLDVTPTSYYNDLEEKLENQALVYINDYYENELTSEEVIITRKVLRNYDLDIDLEDRNGDACSGYVAVKKTHAIIKKKAYISCNNYVTEGYKDWVLE